MKRQFCNILLCMCAIMLLLIPARTAHAQEETEAFLKSGEAFRTALMNIATKTVNTTWIDSRGWQDGGWYTNGNNTVVAMEWTDEDLSVKDGAINVSESGAPVWAYLDGDTFKFYTEAEKVYLNADSGFMFAFFTTLQRVDFLADERIDTSLVTKCYNMFASCEALEAIPTENFDTSHVTTMYGMFYGCDNLTSIDVSGWNVSSCTAFQAMFCYNSIQEITGITNWNMSNATKINNMFAGATKLTKLDLSGWIFPSGRGFEYSSMFSGCSSLKYLDISSFDMTGAYVGVYDGITDMLNDCDSLIIFKAPNTIPVMQAEEDWPEFISLPWGKEWYIDDDNDGQPDTNETYVEVISPITGISHTYRTKTVARLTSGSTINTALKKFILSSPTLNTVDTNIERIEWVPTAFTSETDLAENDSPYPVYARLNGSTIELYTDASEVYLNRISSYMFYNMRALQYIDTTKWNTTNAITMRDMFYNCKSLTALNVSNFNTSNVTDMHTMFEECQALTSLDVRSFDTSQVTNMGGMFKTCKALTSLDLSSFNTSNVTDMSFMFNYCTALVSLNINNFSTPKVTNMSNMFANCQSLVTLTIPFNASQATNMSGMFCYCKNLTTLDISKLDTSKVTNMSGMFHGCQSLTALDLHHFNTTNVTNLESMFDNCNNLTTLNVSGWDTRNVASLSSTFERCSSLQELDLSSWVLTDKLHWMFRTFNLCQSLQTLSLGQFDTSNVVSMHQIFGNDTALTSVDLSYWDLSNIGNYSAFGYTTDRQGVNLYSGSLSKAESLPSMPSGALLIKAPKIIAEGDAVNLPFANSNMGINWYLDDDANNIADSRTQYTTLMSPTTVSHTYVRGDVEGFSLPADITKLQTSSAINRMLKNVADNGYTYTDECLSTTIDTQGTNFVENTITDIVWSTTAFTSDINLARTGFTPVYARKNGTIIELYTDADIVKFHAYSARIFAGMTGLQQISFLSDKIDTSEVTNMHDMFSGEAIQVDSRGIYVANYDTPMSLTTLDLSRFDTQNVTSMANMFARCRFLTSLDVSNFNTANVTDMQGMFGSCKGLTNLDLSNFDTSQVNNMGGMFCNDAALTNLDISSFDTSHVTNMSYMFQGAGPSHLDLSHFNTSNVTNMTYMFTWSKFKTLNLQGWDTSNVTNMNGMFGDCNALTALDLSDFNTSKVTNMNGSNAANKMGMFSSCSNLKTLTLSDTFDTSQITNMESMFDGCNALTILDVSHFDTSNVTNMQRMFYDCAKLTNLDVSHFNTSKVTNMQAMFQYCGALPSLDVTHFDTRNVTNMSYMFDECVKLENINVSNFNTANVTDMTAMFRNDIMLSALDISNFTCNQAVLTSFVQNSGISTIKLPSTLTHIDEYMFSQTRNLSVIYGADGITSIADNAWADNDADVYEFYKYVAAHQDEVYAYVWALVSGEPTMDDILTQQDIDTGNYIVLTLEEILQMQDDPTSTLTAQHVLPGSAIYSCVYLVPELSAIAHYLDHTELYGKQVLYIDGYHSLTAPCWREHNWAANDITIMMYEVSLPATFNLGTNAALDVNIDKWLEDAEVNLEIPNKVVLTNTDKPSAYITYQILPDDDTDTLSFNSSDTPATVEYTASIWDNNVKHCKYSWLYNFDQDMSHASASGQYTGACSITFSR